MGSQKNLELILIPFQTDIWTFSLCIAKGKKFVLFSRSRWHVRATVLAGPIYKYTLGEPDPLYVSLFLSLSLSLSLALVFSFLYSLPFSLSLFHFLCSFSCGAAHTRSPAIASFSFFFLLFSSFFFSLFLRRVSAMPCVCSSVFLSPSYRLSNALCQRERSSMAHSKLSATLLQREREREREIEIEIEKSKK